MSGGEIDIESLGQEIQSALDGYNETVTNLVKEAVETVTKESVTDLKHTSPVRSGAYAKDWASKKTYDSTRTRRNTVFNRKHYQLTHLLEYGHAKRGGGRTEPIKHIEPVEQRTIENLERLIMEAIEDGSGT